MPVSHSNVKGNTKRKEEASFIDMSESIMTDKNTQLGLSQQAPANNAPSTGAVPKAPAQLTNYSVPPPAYDYRPHIAPKKTPRSDVQEMRELMGEAIGEYQKNLEKTINKRIDDGIQAGIAQILGEIKKLNISNTSGNGVGNDGNLNRPPARRLDFEDIRELNSFSRRSNDRNVEQNEEIRSEGIDSMEVQQLPMMGPMRIDKWNIVFDGNPEKLYVEDFVFRVEYLQRYHGCSWKEVIRDFHRLLKGGAEDWYWLTIDTKPIRGWQDLKEALLQEYRTNRSEYEFMRDLEERRQKPGETLDAFFQAIRKLRARLRTPLPEYEMIRIIKRNLRTNIAQIVYPMNLYTVEQLRDVCREVERNFLRRENVTNLPQARPTQSRHPYVHEISQSPEKEEGPEIIEELQHRKSKYISNSTRTGSNKLVCWNCKEVGHPFMECESRQRNLFCYKCGLEGVTCKDCARCAENLTRSVIGTAESHSNQTTADL